MKRLFCFYSVSFALLSLLSLLIGKSFCIASLVLLGIASPIALYFSFKNGKSAFRDTAVFITFAMTALMIALFVSLPRIAQAERLDGMYLRCDGDVTSVSYSGVYTIVTVKCNTINGEKSSQKIAVIRRNDRDDSVDVGSALYFEGSAEFEDSFYNKGKECFLTVFPTKYSVSKSTNPLNRFVYTVRERIRSSVKYTDKSGLVKALTIADKRDVSSETEENFKRLGISHVLAISGLHLSVIVMSFYDAISRIGSPHVLTVLASVLVSVFYMLITGFSPSLMRASQMMAVYFLSTLIRRKNDGITSLFFAGWCMLMMSQWTLFNVGFLLSFLSTLGILAFVRPIKQWYNKRYIDKLERGVIFTKRQKRLHDIVGRLMNASITTVSATVVSFPVILFTMNDFAPASVIGNLVMIPVAKYFLVLTSVAVSLKAAGSSFFATVLSTIVSLLGSFILRLSELLGKISPDTVSLRSYYLNVGGVIAVIVVAILLLKSNKLWSLPLLTLILAVYVPSFNLVSDGLIYDTAVVDCNSSSGAYTSLVRFRGKTYLLDQTSSASRRTGIIDNVIQNDSISYVDKAVFIAFDDSFLDRLDVFVSLVDIGELTLLTDSDIDLDRLGRICEERNIRMEVMYNYEYEICDGIKAYTDREVGTAFVIENGGSSLSVYRSYSSYDYLYEATDTEILIFGGRDCGINRKVSQSGHYRI